MDHPHLEARFVENPEPTSPYGTKALGEPPACSGAPAIRNAILQATGVAVNQAPSRPMSSSPSSRRPGSLRRSDHV